MACSSIWNALCVSDPVWPTLASPSGDEAYKFDKYGDRARVARSEILDSVDAFAQKSVDVFGSHE